FFDKFFFIDETTRDAVLFHHSPENAPTEKAKRIALLVQIADWLSSSERIEKEKEEVTSPTNEPLISIFSNITKIKESVKWSSKSLYYYPLKNLSFKLGEDAVLLPASAKKSVMSGYNLTPDYDYLWEAFIRELEHLSKKKLALELLLQLLEKYLWAVPQAAYLHLPDISLYDHLKTTCAIAACLQQMDLSFEELQELKQALLAKKKTKKPLFLLVKGDISGIQNFIFTIISKFALKTLKGRSLFIEFLTETVARTILREVGLPITNILYCGGGNFYLLLPVNASEKLETLRKEIAINIFNQLGVSLYFAIDWIELSTTDFMPDNISKKWSEVSEKVNQKKLSQYSELDLKENYSAFFEPFEEGGDKKNCAVCHVEITRKEELKKWEENDVCLLCDSFSKMVQSMCTAKKVYLSEGKLTDRIKEKVIKEYDGILESLGTRISFEPSETRKGEQAYFLPEKGLPKIPYRVVPRGIPFNKKEQRINDLDILAKNAEGDEKIAVLKMDIDSLGSIFRFGLGKQSTISRISTLSGMISRFFGGYLNELISQTPHYRENCYTIFAGGDDTLIIGSWNVIFDLAYTIYEDFRRFSCTNPHITLSAGIVVINKKYPIIRAAIEAEEALAKAKSNTKEKNSINIFGESFRWDLYPKRKAPEIISYLKNSKNLKTLNEYAIICYVKELLVDMIEKGCPKSIIHKVAKSVRGLTALTKNASKGIVDIPKVWRFRYYLRDYFKDKSKFKEHACCLESIYNYIIEKNFFSEEKDDAFKPSCILVAARWAELLTRKK
ncbi:MAG: type III-A CRISPR-associated protein Cas10/Csm1, partial [Candidatus Gerdarchaeota archaeon]